MVLLQSVKDNEIETVPIFCTEERYNIRGLFS